MLLVPGTACCKGKQARLLARLRRPLAKHLKLVDGSTGADPATASQPLELDTGRVRSTLQRARDLYLTMALERARATLIELLERVRAAGADGLTPADLALIELYLGAIDTAEHREPEAATHFDAAVVFNPALAPDPDVFSPLVRSAVEQALQRRETTAVTVRSIPPGARIVLDGVVLPGTTPTTLRDVAVGEHYLRLEHPLRKDWAEAMRVSANAQFEMTLQPLARGPLIARLAERPDLLPHALGQLGVAGAIHLESRSGQDLALAVTRKGDPLLHHETLALVASDRRVDRVADHIATIFLGPILHPRERAKVAAAPPWYGKWWVWAAAGAAVTAIAVGIAVPLAQDNADSREIRVPLK